MRHDSGRGDRLRVLALALAFGMASFCLPGATPEADADVNVYTTAGLHTVGGRKWRTTCEPYSSTITRCRAEIWATQIVPAATGDQFTQVTGWAFNNLTYFGATEAAWSGNPLAADGSWASNGRRWKTSCRDEWTGPTGCRSFIWADWIAQEGTAYVAKSGWLFNNVVAFAPPARRSAPAVGGANLDPRIECGVRSGIPSGYAFV